MGKLDVVQWGSDRLRSGPWRGDHSIAQITPAPGHVPSVVAIDRRVRSLQAEGYRAVLSSALTHAEQQPFLAVGFTVHERLHLLRRDLTGNETFAVVRPAGVRMRRGRRTDRNRVLDVDRSAFPPFWQFDAAGLDDARAATRSSRFRVAEAGGDVVGYAVTGRAGNIAYLQRLAVRPDEHRRGIGTALVYDALHWARRHGAASMLVNTQESNERALALYEQLGFAREAYGLAVLERPLSGLEASA